MEPNVSLVVIVQLIVKWVLMSGGTLKEDKTLFVLLVLAVEFAQPFVQEEFLNLKMLPSKEGLTPTLLLLEIIL